MTKEIRVKCIIDTHSIKNENNGLYLDKIHVTLVDKLGEKSNLSRCIDLRKGMQDVSFLDCIIEDFINLYGMDNLFLEEKK